MVGVATRTIVRTITESWTVRPRVGSLAATSRWTRACWTRTSAVAGTTAEHCDARAILGATKGDHVLADVGSDNLTVMVAAVGKDVLDQVVAKLVTSNCRSVSSCSITVNIGSTYCQSTACEGGQVEPRTRAPGSARGTRCHRF